MAAASWTGTPRIRGSSEFMRMFLLTISFIGLQFTWGTEMTYLTPYLLQLGLTKSKLSLVWIAGPLSGLVMQPIVGTMADKSTSKYGRRRPFMVGGMALVSLCLLSLGWTGEIVGSFVADAETKKHMTIFVAVLCIYVLDFAINAVQSTGRSLVVDTLPVSKQQLGQAWVSRMVAVGHLLVYGIGALDLTRILPNTVFGDSQFKQVTVIAALALITTTSLTCWAVQERVLIATSKQKDSDTGAFAVLANIFNTTWHLPRRVQAICWVQFWSWIGFFPFLFYTSEWLGELYLRPIPEDQRSQDALGEIGRVGSMSLIVMSIVSSVSSVILPWLVMSPEDDEKPGFTPRPPPSLAHIGRYARKPSLLTAWTAAHLIFAGTMIFAPFVSSLGLATFLVAVCGIPWAVSSWAPFTFIGIETNRIGSRLPTSHSRQPSSRRLSNESFDALSEPNGLRILHLRHDSTDSLASVANTSTGELSGIYLGILNVYTTLPQFVGTFISFIVFSTLEPGKSPELAKDARPEEHHPTEGLNGVGVCLFIGALSAVGAAYATQRLKYVY